MLWVARYRIWCVMLTIGAMHLMGAPKDSIHKIILFPPHELLILTSATSLELQEDFSSPPNQIRLSLRGVRASEATRNVLLREMAQFREISVRNQTDGCSIIIEREPGSGYIACVLPYSQTLYIRAINWNDPVQQHLAFGIDAWQHKQYRQALRWWTSALSSGSRDAAMWLGIAEAVLGNRERAISYLQSFVNANTIIPDVHAALAQSLDNTEQVRLHRQLYQRQALRPLQPAAKITLPTLSDSSNNELSLLELLANSAQAAPDTQPQSQTTGDTAGATSKHDTDLFTQLRRLQGRSDTISSISSSSDSVLSSWLLTAVAVCGTVCILIGVILLRGYYRWRAGYAQQFTSTIATHQSQFEQLFNLESSGTDTQHNEPEPGSPSASPAMHTGTFLDFENHDKTELIERQTSQRDTKIDERLFYHTDDKYYTSSEMPTPHSKELSEQEKDLLELLNTLSMEHEGNNHPPSNPS